MLAVFFALTVFVVGLVVAWFSFGAEPRPWGSVRLVARIVAALVVVGVATSSRPWLLVPYICGFAVVAIWLLIVSAGGGDDRDGPAGPDGPDVAEH